MPNKVNRITICKSTKTTTHLDRNVVGTSAVRYDKIPHTASNDNFDPRNRDASISQRPNYNNNSST